jgi:predicted metal-dependent hydrolase
VPEPELAAEDLALFDRGVTQFNAGEYFECHDTLEEVWSGVRGPSRDFFQALIQVSVGLYHWTGGNHAGAASMFQRAFKRFRKYPDLYFGFAVAAQRALLEEWLAAISRGDVPPQRPCWEFSPRR